MKHIFFLSCIALSTLRVFADCTSSYITVFPTGSTIKQNSIFMVEGYGTSQLVVKGFNTKYPVYLKNGDKRIDLIVQETLVGEFQLTQAVLKPKQSLEIGEEYTLTIDNLPATERLGRYDYEKRTWRNLTYTVVAGNDSTAPAIAGTPKEIRKSFIAFGCGPQKWVVFDCPVSDSSEFLVRATVKDISSGKKTTYLIVHSNNEIIIGHGMCSGAFYFSGEGKYEVSFSFFDASGNTSSTLSPIPFTEPVPGDGEED